MTPGKCASDLRNLIGLKVTRIQVVFSGCAITKGWFLLSGGFMFNDNYVDISGLERVFQNEPLLYHNTLNIFNEYLDICVNELVDKRSWTYRLKDLQ